jgi:hypothetical protein
MPARMLWTPERAGWRSRGRRQRAHVGGPSRRPTRAWSSQVCPVPTSVAAPLRPPPQASDLALRLDIVRVDGQRMPAVGAHVHATQGAQSPVRPSCWPLRGRHGGAASRAWASARRHLRIGSTRIGRIETFVHGCLVSTPAARVSWERGKGESSERLGGSSNSTMERSRAQRATRAGASSRMHQPEQLRRPRPDSPVARRCV